MSLYEATRADWKAFDRDQGSDLPAEPLCTGCDGELLDGHCASCDEALAAADRQDALRNESYREGLEGISEAKRASAHDDANRRMPWANRMRAA